MLMNRNLHLYWRDISVFIFPTIVFLIFGLFIILLAPVDFRLNFSADYYSSGNAVGGFYLVITFFILYLFISTAVFSVFLRDFFNIFDMITQVRLLAACAIIFIVIALPIGALITSLDITPRAYGLLGKDIFEEAMKSASDVVRDWIPASDCTCNNKNESKMLLLYDWGISIGNFFTAVVVTSLVIGTISCLAFKLDEKYSEFIHVFQIERLRKYLYMSSIILVSGVFLMMSWLYWPAFMFRESTGEKAEFINLANGISAYYGVNFSLFLLAYYIPVAVILSRRADELVDRRVKEKGRNISANTVMKWRSELGATVSFVNAYKSTFAILSPFLTGSFGFVVSFLSGSG